MNWEGGGGDKELTWTVSLVTIISTVVLVVTAMRITNTLPIITFKLITETGAWQER